MPSGNRDRLGDCMEEFVKYTIFMRSHFDLFSDRYSERTERQSKVAREEQARMADNAKVTGPSKDKHAQGAGFVNGVNVNGL